MFLVLSISPTGAFVVDLMGPIKKDPLPVGLVLPRDSEDWVIDDKNIKLTDEEKGILEQKLLLFEMMGN